MSSSKDAPFPVKWILFAGFMFTLMAAFKFLAMTQLPLVANELQDLTIGLGELDAWKKFYFLALAPEEARLPHLLSLPFAFTSSPFNLGFYRLPFLVIHFLTLILFYLIAKKLFADRRLPSLWLGLMSLCCYLSAYAVFSVTTGDTLYVFFHTLAVYVVLRNGYTRFYRLMLILSLCIASKVVGVFLILACFLHQLRVARKMRVSAHLTHMLIGSLVYLLTLIVINFISIPHNEKSLFCSLAGLGYLSFFFLKARWPRPVPKAYSPVYYWLTGVAVCASLVTCFSPVYQNMTNVIRMIAFSPLRIEGWAGFPTAFSILTDKLGWLSVAMILGSIVFLHLRRQKVEPMKMTFLATVFAVHFVAVAMTAPKLSWSFVAIFPFVFVPVFLVIQRTVVPRWAAIMLFTIIFAEQAVKYAYWYPLAHWDGAQYGKSHIGDGKSALVTFEFVPDLMAYLQNLPKDPDHPLQVLVQMSDEYDKNKYFTEVLQFSAQTRRQRFQFLSEALALEHNHFVLTSPIESSSDNEMTIRGYKLIQTIEIKGIAVANLWQPS